MHQLYFIRHGKDWAHITKQYSYKKANYSLTPIGVIQSIQTAKYLLDKKIDSIYCSPLHRAYNTATIIGTILHLPIIKIDEFIEINVGILDGKISKKENQIMHQYTIQKWSEGSQELRFLEGENLIELYERLKQGILKIISNNNAHTSVIVCHSGLLTATLSLLCPEVNLELLSKQPCHNCSITKVIVELRNGELKGDLVFWSSQDHLCTITSKIQ